MPTWSSIVLIQPFPTKVTILVTVCFFTFTQNTAVNMLTPLGFYIRNSYYHRVLTMLWMLSTLHPLTYVIFIEDI